MHGPMELEWRGNTGMEDGLLLLLARELDEDDDDDDEWMTTRTPNDL